MINASHLHLILGHFPVVLTPLGLTFLLLAYLLANRTLERAALGLFVGAALFILPVFLLGEGAEEDIEHLHRAKESVIESHEGAGEVALWLSLGLGVLSIVSIAVGERPIRRAMLRGTAVLSIVALAAIANTANKGGMISHPEAYQAERGAGNIVEGATPAIRDDD